MRATIFEQLCLFIFLVTSVLATSGVKCNPQPQCSIANNRCKLFNFPQANFELQEVLQINGKTHSVSFGFSALSLLSISNLDTLSCTFGSQELTIYGSSVQSISNPGFWSKTLQIDCEDHGDQWCLPDFQIGYDWCLKVNVFNFWVCNFWTFTKSYTYKSGCGSDQNYDWPKYCWKKPTVTTLKTSSTVVTTPKPTTPSTVKTTPTTIKPSQTTCVESGPIVPTAQCAAPNSFGSLNLPPASFDLKSVTQISGSKHQISFGCSALNLLSVSLLGSLSLHIGGDVSTLFDASSNTKLISNPGSWSKDVQIDCIDKGDHWCLPNFEVKYSWCDNINLFNFWACKVWSFSKSYSYKCGCGGSGNTWPQYCWPKPQVCSVTKSSTPPTSSTKPSSSKATSSTKVSSSVPPSTTIPPTSNIPSTCPPTPTGPTGCTIETTCVPTPQCTPKNNRCDLFNYPKALFNLNSVTWLGGKTHKISYGLTASSSLNINALSLLNCNFGSFYNDLFDCGKKNNQVSNPSNWNHEVNVDCEDHGDKWCLPNFLISYEWCVSGVWDITICKSFGFTKTYTYNLGCGSDSDFDFPKYCWPKPKPPASCSVVSSSTKPVTPSSTVPSSSTPSSVKPSSSKPSSVKPSSSKPSSSVPSSSKPSSSSNPPSSSVSPSTTIPPTSNIPSTCPPTPTGPTGCTTTCAPTPQCTPKNNRCDLFNYPKALFNLNSVTWLGGKTHKISYGLTASSQLNINALGLINNNFGSFYNKLFDCGKGNNPVSNPSN